MRDRSDTRRPAIDQTGQNPAGAAVPWPDHLFAPRRPRVYVVSGPTAVGKDALIAELRGLVRGLRQVVTCTTRPRRDYEQDGVHYYFLSRVEFERRVAAGRFLESNVVHGELYGTPIDRVREILAAGDDALLKIEVKGGVEVRRHFPDAVLIFIAPESLAVLSERLARRSSEPADDWEVRLATAVREMAVAGDYDYFVVNRNGRLGETVARVAAIVEAERARVARVDRRELG